MAATAQKPVNAPADKKPAAQQQEAEQRVTGPVTSESAKSLQHAAGESQTVTVDLANVYIDKSENIRDIKSYTEKDIGEMMAQIEAFGGLMHSITVSQIKPHADTDNKELILVSGYRRSLALLALAEESPQWAEYIKQVPALLVNRAGKTVGATRFLQLLENEARSDLNQMEVALAINEALNDKSSDFNQRDIARMLGKSEAAVSQTLKLLRLPKEVQEMVSSGKLSWSHARELFSPSRNVPETQWQLVATKGAGMVYNDFINYLDKTFGEGEAAATTDGTGKSSQKPPSMLRATMVQGKFVPFLKQQVENADASNKAFTAKDVAQARLDAMNTVLLNPDTVLSKDIAPYLAEQKAKEEQEEAASESKKAEEKFYREQVKRVEKLVDAPLDVSNPNAERPTLAKAYAQVGQEIGALAAEVKAGLGFALPTDPNALMQKLNTMHQGIQKERAESKAKRDKAKAEKEAADKAAADAANANAETTEANTAAAGQNAPTGGTGNTGPSAEGAVAPQGMNAPPSEGGTAK